MSAWMLQQVVERGGSSISAPLEEEPYGYFRATYRWYYLWWVSWENKLNVAPVGDLDRWSNSRVYEGESPATVEEIDAIIDTFKEKS